MPAQVPIITGPDTPLTFYVRLVFNDNILTPVSGRRIKFSIVDSFGFSGPQREINLSAAATGPDGFSQINVIFQAHDIGVYRLRVDYDDRGIDNFSFSPNIIVISHRA
ncbi:hypothetical protein NKH45_17195 [Mesorhizobium sp. M1156]|uniref:hypothetical protein n=1 Tax=Mesorhizobium sp. M1156 TaxID=2957064 RepID=UPI00333704CE